MNRILLPAMFVPMMLVLAACGEDERNTPGEALPSRSDEKLTEGVKPDILVEENRDPTPQAGTGGEIPGYEPAEPQVERQSDAEPDAEEESSE